jgi:nucleoside-diphosphate-sugar epimerase
MMMLLTGASGFVGAAILEAAQLRGMSVRLVFRCQTSAEHRGAVIVPTLDADTDWSAAV